MPGGATAVLLGLAVAPGLVRGGRFVVRTQPTGSGIGGNMRAAIMGMATAAMLSGCAMVPPPAPVVAPRARPVPLPMTIPRAGLERVLGQDARALAALFGAPDADVQEGAGRKLQFAGPICVLDAYLYPSGRRAAVVTHIDTRERDGSPIDRASCVAALVRRGGGK